MFVNQWECVTSGGRRDLGPVTLFRRIPVGLWLWEGGCVIATSSSTEYRLCSTTSNSAHYGELYCLTGLCYGLSQSPRIVIVDSEILPRY